MAWKFSTGFTRAVLARQPRVTASVISNKISFGVGDGLAGFDTINDSGAGLGIFKKHDRILIIGGVNANICLQVFEAGPDKLSVTPGLLSMEVAESDICLIALTTGSVAEILRNGVIDCYSGVRPVSADDAETGTLLLTITRNKKDFTPGLSENGLNLGTLEGQTLKRAIDPLTNSKEEWTGACIADGVLGWCRWYANDKASGISAEAIRMDGIVGVSMGELKIPTGTTVKTGSYYTFDDVSFDVVATE